MKPLQSTLIFLIVVVSQSIWAIDSIYRPISLSHGISLEIPAHWQILPIGYRQNLVAFGDAMVSNSGVDTAGTKKENLLAVNSIPQPINGKIRVSVSAPPDLSQNELLEIANSSPHDFEMMQTEFLNSFKQLALESNLKIVEMYPVRIEKVNNHNALVISYIREKSPAENSVWMVNQYKIPISNQYLIEFTLSYQQSNSLIFKPILERVKRSIRF